MAVDVTQINPTPAQAKVRQTIDVNELRERALDPVVEKEIATFARNAKRFLEGELDDDVFRVFRLNNGIYGQRQGGTSQMVRVKVPHGRLSPEQLEMLGYLGERYSRGWGHITTRQNVQFHFVELSEVADLMRDLAVVGLTTREACGDTVRNVMGCHLAGACPFEILDITPWAQATTEHFLRHPYGQRLPRKFKINFSGCDTDCGQAMFNDVGVIAAARKREDGSIEPGFRVFLAGGLGANPHPAIALEEFTAREDLLPTLEAVLRTFDHYGNRDNKLRARLKWLVDSMGADELRERIKKERRFLIGTANFPGGIPQHVLEVGDAPAGMGAVQPRPLDGVIVKLRSTDPDTRWDEANVVRGSANGTVSVNTFCRLGDITGDQFRGVAAIARDFDLEVRVTNRQNFVFRQVTEEQLPQIRERLRALDMAEPGAQLARDVVACPGADTCNLAVTQSRGLADDIGRALEESGLGEVGDVSVNISGCTNSCGQHHISSIGFYGLERRAHGRSAPGYQMLLGGRVGREQIEFGEKAAKLPAKNAAAAVVRIVGKFAEDRQAGERFHEWVDRAGGAKAVGALVADLDEFPDPEVSPDFYVDFGETGPYEAVVGASECAT
ncbi:MAG TPA: nitrite/sulfite reductase [Acidimicrobiia bacterium]|nr:nitrite/sulfite reductase [Acidimicrobiia bacterium]